MCASSPQQLTLADIARRAGVGVGTASRALNNAPGVAPATRQRVLEVAERFSYVVSPDAARLAGGTTRRVAIVIPHLSRWFFGAMLEGLESVLRDADLDVLLYHVDSLADREHFFEHLPARRKVDAVVVVAFPVDEAEQQRLSLLGVDIIAAGGQNAAYPHVCIDDLAAGRQALGHLLHLGHRRIGMIEALDPDQPTLRTLRSGRYAAYFQALSDRRIRPDPDLVVSTEWGGEQGATAAARLLSLPEPPTAIYAHSDEVAVGAMRTIRRAGLRIPEDISVVGIDDAPIAALTDLTTVHQPVREQGVIAAGMLLARLNGDEPAADCAIQVPTHLVVRHSTAPPRSDPSEAAATGRSRRPRATRGRAASGR